VQAVGKIAIDLKSADIDMLSLSGHKLHGPKGIGALYLRKGTPFAPLVRGGPQERRRRGGTENVPAIIGLGKAAELAGQHFADEQGRVRVLRDRLEQGIIPGVGHCAVLGDIEHRLPNTLNIAFQHLEGEPIVMRLNQAGIAASLGSACASGSMEPSHVLRAMNVPPDLLRGAVRFSLSRDTTEDDIMRVLQVLPDIIGRLRETSPAWLQHHPSQSADPIRSTELT
jgi:cysteine desulfurase